MCCAYTRAHTVLLLLLLLLLLTVAVSGAPAAQQLERAAKSELHPTRDAGV